jgi:hypothetical protein
VGYHADANGNHAYFAKYPGGVFGQLTGSAGYQGNVVVMGRCLGDRTTGEVVAVVVGPGLELGCGAVDRIGRHANVVQ